MPVNTCSPIDWLELFFVLIGNITEYFARKMNNYGYVYIYFSFLVTPEPVMCVQVSIIRNLIKDTINGPFLSSALRLKELVAHKAKS